MRHDPPPGTPTRRAYGRRDETCPISTGGGTRRIQSVREGEGGGGGLHGASSASASSSSRTDAGTSARWARRVRLVRGEGRDVSA
jgi:hypothetical protein